MREVVLDGELTLDVKMDGEPANVIKVGGSVFPDYTGQTDVIPSAVQQTLQTKDRAVRANITIEAIPNNYGLVTVNGGTLTVS